LLLTYKGLLNILTSVWWMRYNQLIVSKVVIAVSPMKLRNYPLADQPNGIDRIVMQAQ
jgi:hypothetical protein